jgi:hypothetical protein|tara:strand:+ start:20 stop:343 length:324 start_codon:yes stop_codon:yes gene_type:complete
MIKKQTILGIESRTKKRSGFLIFEKIVNGYYLALNFETTGRISVYCNPKGKNGTWIDTPVNQLLSKLNGISRDKFLNFKSTKDLAKAVFEFIALENHILTLPKLGVN